METTYRITGTNHDQGANEIHVDRDSKGEADGTCKLMLECGYRTVTIEPYLDWSVGS